MKSKTKNIIQMVSKQTEEDKYNKENLSRDSSPAAPSLTELKITYPNLMRSLINENKRTMEESLVRSSSTKAKEIECAMWKLIFDNPNKQLKKTKQKQLHYKYFNTDVEKTKSTEASKEKVENWLGSFNSSKHMVSCTSGLHYSEENKIFIRLR